MTINTRAVQALALIGALFLASCGGPRSSADMYKGERQGPNISTPATKPVTIDSTRLAAIKAHGLDTQTNPSKLVGLSLIEIEKTLGEPSFVRKDKGVQIWQYRTTDCILDLFLYEKDGRYNVSHSELRGPMLDSAGEMSCFKTIVLGKPS